MSVESSTLVWMHSRSKGTARLVLLAIADHDGDGGAWPSIETLMRKAGQIDRRAVQRAISKLEELGEIRRYVQGGGTAGMENSKRPNRYEILIECPPYCDRTKRHKDIRKPLISIEDEHQSDPAVVAPPRGLLTAGPAVVAPPKPSFNSTTQLKKETHLIARETKHIYAETGWCITCQVDPHRLDVLA